MAINGTIIQRASQTSTSAGTITLDADDGWATPTSGNILLAIHSVRAASAITFSVPSGFSTVQTYSGTDSNYIAGNVAWKVSDGTETSFTMGTSAGSVTTQCSAVVEIPSTDLDTSALDGSNEDETNYITQVFSQATGTVSVTADSGLAIGVVCVLRWNDWGSGTTSWSDSYVSQFFDRSSNGGSAGVALGTKVLSSSGNTSSTFSTDYTSFNSPAYGALLVFGAAAASQPGIEVYRYFPGASF